MSELSVFPKCRGVMQEGFILEHASYASSSASSWVEGAPINNLLFGPRTIGKEQHPYRAFAAGRVATSSRMPRANEVGGV